MADSAASRLVFADAKKRDATGVSPWSFTNDREQIVNVLFAGNLAFLLTFFVASTNSGENKSGEDDAGNPPRLESRGDAADVLD